MSATQTEEKTRMNTKHESSPLALSNNKNFGETNNIEFKLYVFFGLLITCFFAIFYHNVSAPLFAAPPSESHTLLALEHGVRFGLDQPFEMGHAFGPRFTAYYTFIIQQQLSGTDVKYYIIFNGWVMALAHLFAFVVARQLAGSLLAGIIATTALAFCWPIWEQTIAWLTGRQGPMALIFGLLFIWYSCKERNSHFLISNLILSLLMFLALTSKEFSLSVLPASILYVLVKRGYRSLNIFVGPIVMTLLFVVFRVTLFETGPIPGTQAEAAALSLKCEDMAFFNEIRRSCISLNLLDVDNLIQISYNAFIGILVFFLPPIFGDHYGVSHLGFIGLDRLSPENISLALFLTLSLILIFVKNRAVFYLALALAIGNCIIMIPFFRLRNFGFTFFASSLVLGYGLHIVSGIVSDFFRLNDIKKTILRSSLVTIVVFYAIFHITTYEYKRLRDHSERLASHRLNEETVCIHVRNILGRVNRLNPGYRSDPKIIASIMRRHDVDIEAVCSVKIE